jgi:hypothetical protein
MIEDIFKRNSVVLRHKQAPLLKEREQFLAHCQQHGTSHKALHNMAPELIAVIRLLRMQKLLEVGLEEIKQAAKVWAEEQIQQERPCSCRAHRWTMTAGNTLSPTCESTKSTTES